MRNLQSVASRLEVPQSPRLHMEGTFTAIGIPVQLAKQTSKICVDSCAGSEMSMRRKRQFLFVCS